MKQQQKRKEPNPIRIKNTGNCKNPLSPGSPKAFHGWEPLLMESHIYKTCSTKLTSKTTLHHNFQQSIKHCPCFFCLYPSLQKRERGEQSSRTHRRMSLRRVLICISSSAPGRDVHPKWTGAVLTLSLGWRAAELVGNSRQSRRRKTPAAAGLASPREEGV